MQIKSGRMMLISWVVRIGFRQLWDAKKWT